ncbi:hypothetical protein, partial [Streptomyces chryseus]|uniref:hypothetical protein n=1 Tax=Streptomyces chryseus TaxID=68186 RepID=UPI00313771AF
MKAKSPNASPDTPANSRAYAPASDRTADSSAALTRTTCESCANTPRTTGAGGSSTITWAFTPPIPNALTA